MGAVALPALPPRQAEAILLRHGHDLTGREIASRMDVSERRVRYLLCSARTRLARSGIQLPKIKRGRRRMRVATDGGLDLNAI